MSQGFSIPRFRLPSLGSAIGAHLPQWPHSLALATALNAAAIGLAISICLGWRFPNRIPWG